MRSNFDSIKTPFFTVLFIFLFLFLYTKLLGPIPFSVNSVTTTTSDLFTVSGEGEATAVPETASFSVGVSKSGSTAEVAKDTMNTLSNQIVDALKKLGIDEKDIKTINFSVNPEYDLGRPAVMTEPMTTEQKISGYTANQTIEVKTDTVELANKALDAATKAGANVTNSVQFVLSDETRDKLEMEARKDAIAKAKKKANEISALSGVKLGRIINISESTYGMPLYAERSALMTKDSVEPQTELQPGENTVNLTVTLFYETL